MKNQKIKKLIKLETRRQNSGIELIASENYPSRDVREAAGSILTAKYAEGYPGKRYYGGCEYIDQVEQYAIDEACKLFHCRYANVQPHSGSQANFAAYHALMPKGGSVLSLCLNDGAHLSHGSPVSFSSKMYDFHSFPLDEDGKINYDWVEECALKYRPNVILAGYSAYPYSIDFKRFKKIANKVNAFLMVDMAHIAGIVAAGLCQNPCDYADIVTTTTHKTLRGPRGGLILTNSEWLSKKIDSAVFPFTQGGGLQHIVAAKAICFEEAAQPEFKEYIKNVLNNTKICAEELKRLGAIASDTNNHLFLLNTLESYGLTGLEAQLKLEEIGITTNKNMIPGDKLKPNETSGLRIGFAAITTRGCTAENALTIARLIHRYLKFEITKEFAVKQVYKIVKKLKKIQKI